jgi:hypothetical protein
VAATVRVFGCERDDGKSAAGEEHAILNRVEAAVIKWVSAVGADGFAVPQAAAEEQWRSR